MAERVETESRKLLGRLRDAMAGDDPGQARLDKITHLIADSIGTEVCSIYLFRDEETLELCATEGLNPESVHQTRMRLGEGLVGRVARRRQVVNTADAPNARGFRFMPETGEEVFSSFLGVPIQRLGDALGVLVVQSKDAREYSADEIYALEVVAMVLAEMTELGAFVGEGSAMGKRHSQPAMLRGTIAQEGVAEGHIWLHEPRVVVTNPIADDPHRELERLKAAVEELRVGVDKMLALASADKEQAEVLEAYRMFANSKGWMRRMEEDISNGLSAEAAVEKEQSLARARMGQASDNYLRERLSDLDDLSNRLLRILTGQGKDTGADMPPDPILVARNIGPAELLDYGRALKGIVLEAGSVGSHAAIVARALAIPLIVHAERATLEALNGDHVLVDGEQGIVHLRPDEQVASAFHGDMGLTSARFPEENCAPASPGCTDAPTGGSPEVEEKGLSRVTLYSGSLAVPARRDWQEPAVLRGKALFAQLGCASCHEDVHEGRFDASEHLLEVDGRSDCARCHSTASFRDASDDFDHARWTGWPLDGAHAAADCTSCHAPLRRPDAHGRTWARANGTDCASCHEGPHGDQFSARRRHSVARVSRVEQIDEVADCDRLRSIAR